MDRILPNSEISFVEYNADCAEKYRDTIERKAHGKLYVGDQADVTFLKSIVDDQAGKQFDVIIDDGTPKPCALSCMTTYDVACSHG